MRKKNRRSRYGRGVPSDLTLKAMNAVHRAAQWLSMGKLGWTAMKMPVVELTTIGRKSGKARSVLLTSPLQMGSAHVVVASRGGDDKPPAWLGNLVANPDVEVAFAGRAKVHPRAVVAPCGRRPRLLRRLSKGRETRDRPRSAGTRSMTGPGAVG